jgi:hypothetical protein
MKSFMLSGAHRRAMPKLRNWCDEASVVHWTQPDSNLPPWEEAMDRMLREGRTSKVDHPSPAQKEITLTPGQTFYEGPNDIHVIGRNPSTTKPAKFVVLLLKNKDAPALVPVK